MKPPIEKLKDTMSIPSKKKKKKKKKRKKKKKKRRHSGKGKSRINRGTKMDISSVSINENVSLDDNLSPYARSSHQNGSNEVMSHAVLSHFPSVHRGARPKGLLTVRHHCRERRPLRHNFPHCRGGQLRRYSSPLFLGNYPRSSNVSVSHYWYSSEVQVQKKRKTPPSDNSLSASPFKKPLVMFNYMPNLVCNIDNVAIAPNPEGYRAIM